MDDHSVAIVVLDTLRKDTFDRYFEWVEGTVFDNAYSTSHWTVPAHASLITGKYGSEVGVHGKSRMFDYPGDTIVEKLQESGYTTVRGLRTSRSTLGMGGTAVSTRFGGPANSTRWQTTPSIGPHSSRTTNVRVR